MERPCNYARAADGVFVLDFDEHAVQALDVHPKKINTTLITWFLSSWVCVLGDSPLRPVERRPIKIFKKFSRDLLTRPLRESIIHYADLMDRLLASLSESAVTGTYIKEFEKTPVYREYLHFFRTGNDEALRYVETFCWFGKKLRIDDPKLGGRSMADWLAVEERMAHATFEENDISDLRNVIAALLPDPDVRPNPKHGPGSVAGISGKSSALKNTALTADWRIWYAYFREGESPFRSEAFPWAVMPIDWVQSLTDADRISYLRVSELLFVPKTIKTARSICREPAILMYFQQCVLDAFKRAFRKGLIRRFVTLEDQSRNQWLSQWGSITRRLDTIDLSAASDSVSAVLVQRTFPRAWWYHIHATRSEFVQLPNDEIVKLAKLSPMGSAVCFPVQCVLFTAISILAVARRRGIEAGSMTRSSAQRMIRAFARDPKINGYQVLPLAVYGDDIVCDSDYTDDIIQLLTKLHFRVNEGKSFVGPSMIRESCGSYWYDGFDVRPTLFRVHTSFAEGTVDAESLASLVAGANNAGKAGLRTYQLYLIRLAKSVTLDPRFITAVPAFPGLPPYHKNWLPRYSGENLFDFSTEATHSLCFEVKHPQKVTTGIKFARPYQYDVCLTLQLVDKSESVPDELEDGSERYAYYRWWESLSAIDVADYWKDFFQPTRGEPIPRVADRGPVSVTMVALKLSQLNVA